MQPQHVKEAFRLLNKSIIRVEQPDIQLEEDVEYDDAMETEGMHKLALINILNNGFFWQSAK